MNVFQRELDVSDPFTFLFLKRGILRTSLTLSRSSLSDFDFFKNMFKSSRFLRLLR